MSPREEPPMMLRLTFASLLIAAPVFAQGTEAPAEAEKPKADAETAEAKAAKDLVTKYLNAVKAKKWADAKKFIHPQTITVIADHKKRLGKEDHAMAPWAAEKTEYWLKDFKVLGARVGPVGTIIVETSEDNFQVQEKGLAEGDPANYLVGTKDKKLYVVDKKRGEGFPVDSIKIGYKGYFDKVAKTEAEAE
jgi:hypothetical protein